MSTWRAVAVRLLEDPPLPKKQKTFLLSDQDNAYLQELVRRLDVDQTEAVRWAIRNMLGALQRGEPVYLTAPPEGPEPPTSAPSAAPSNPLQVVENRAKRSRRPPPPRRSNTKRVKK